mmetsp:Transcript_24266/g.49111  ORF Transcript_24266/g.49111 Transcript_24266/m.49111 type:complete len:110 (-) Transcript_24266:447-776(-)
MTSSIKTVVLLSAMALAGVFSFSPSIPPFRKRTAPQHNSVLQQRPNEPQHVNIQSPLATALASSTTNDSTSETITYEPPEDAIIQIKPKAMSRLIELKQKKRQRSKKFS